MTVKELVTYLDRNAYRAGDMSQCLLSAANLAEASNNFCACQDETALKQLNGAWARATRFYEAINPPTALNAPAI